ncbi:hypothetical protein [Hymenobacter cheonanensis]|uniref:hypothetical protein n=1 Tax=Hymenobacter sp. CA2-7 TaxID=3063993 RepID=UPI002712F6B5|nr:hypothetical protein [Hymenobacter sp. CA2-7]MDO7884295.1 hypothetical protein [Hymenobacter sp. CA2-7]
MKALVLFFICCLLTSCSDAHLSSTSWLASAAIATVISTLITSLISFFIKDKEYKNDYYKKVIDKRLKVYELLEAALIDLNSRTMDEGDSRPYLTIFGDTKRFEEAGGKLQDALQAGLWLNQETLLIAYTINKHLFDLIQKHDTKNAKILKRIGKDNFDTIFDLRQRLEQYVREDISDLHNVPRFFRKKTKALV